MTTEFRNKTITEVEQEIFKGLFEAYKNVILEMKKRTDELSWNEYIIEFRNNRTYELYNEFIKGWCGCIPKREGATLADIEKWVEKLTLHVRKEVHEKIVNLQKRISSKLGEEFESVYFDVQPNNWGYPIITGLFENKEGKEVRVESIFCGGLLGGVQKPHIRVYASVLGKRG